MATKETHFKNSNHKNKAINVQSGKGEGGEGQEKVKGAIPRTGTELVLPKKTENGGAGQGGEQTTGAPYYGGLVDPCAVPKGASLGEKKWRASSPPCKRQTSR